MINRRQLLKITDAGARSLATGGLGWDLQVNGGMAAFFLVSDDEEQAAGLPGSECDVPLVIQDRTF